MKHLYDIKPVAYASSKDYRKNHLTSAAQYASALEKNRVDFDIPLVPESALKAAIKEIERLGKEWQESLIAQNEIGSALCLVLDLLPDPHLDADKVQAHFVRKARKVLEEYEPKLPTPDDCRKEVKRLVGGVL